LVGPGFLRPIASMRSDPDGDGENREDGKKNERDTVAHLGAILSTLAGSSAIDLRKSREKSKLTACRQVSGTRS
jgi:hypothetical protein